MPPRTRTTRPRAITLLLCTCALLAACGLASDGPADVTGAASTPDPDATALLPSPTVGPSPAQTPTGPPPTVPIDPAATLTDPPGPDSPSTEVGMFPVDLIPEASGVAASAVDPDRLWLLDDGPGTTTVTAVALDGTVQATITMAGVSGRDTEALAIAACGPGDPVMCLYVGDIGDNRGRHPSIQVHRFPEPATPAEGQVVNVSTVTLTLPDGPVDAEAMIVDDQGSPMILTKEQGVSTILRAPTFTDTQMVDLGELALPQPRRPLQSMVTGVLVTDAVLHPDQATVLLRTYDSVLALTRGPGQSLADLASWSIREVTTPVEPQGEAITLHPRPTTPRDTWGWVTVSESIGAITRTTDG